MIYFGGVMPPAAEAAPIDAFYYEGLKGFWESNNGGGAAWSIGNFGAGADIRNWGQTFTPQTGGTLSSFSMVLRESWGGWNPPYDFGENLRGFVAKWNDALQGLDGAPLFISAPVKIKDQPNYFGEWWRLVNITVPSISLVGGQRYVFGFTSLDSDQDAVPVYTKITVAVLPSFMLPPALSYPNGGMVWSSGALESPGWADNGGWDVVLPAMIPNPVPVLPALWLLVSALAGLAVTRRIRSSRQAV